MVRALPIVLVALTACGGGSPGSPGGTGAAAGSGGVATTGGGGSGTTTTSSGGSGGAPTTTGEPCGNGVVDAQETCDVAIPVGEPGACPASCNDGVTCTTDTLVDAGSCSAACAHADVSACTNGDGCCPAGCPADTDCAPLSRIKHSVITDSGQEMWSRNGYWDGAKYTNWTDFSGQGLTQLVPELGANQAYRGVDHVVRADGTVKITMLQMDGKKAWSRYGTWDGAGYSGWTPWSDQFGDLSQIIPTLPAGQTYRSYDHVVFPDGKIKQTLLTSDGTKIWYRSATWNGSAYDNWTDWTDVGGDLTGLLPGQGASQSFRSFNHVVLVDQRMKQLVLAEDGHKAWYRYATWDGAAYGNWTAWTSQFGDLTQLLPGKGNNQAYLGFDEAALAGAGAMGGCQNGCDDSDPCTVDSCVGNTCQHAAKVCDDADVCTVDLCVDGACQYSAQSCDDGNECTDDFCSAGCQHSNNAASCPGGTCQGGQCVGGGGSGGAGGGSGGGGAGGGPSCECTTGCTDSCGQPCNDGASCAANATCQGGSCLCAGGPFCGGVCCPAGNSCNGGKCCPPDSVICAGKCGTVTHACGKTVNCGGCPAPAMCCPGNYCDETCQ